MWPLPSRSSCASNSACHAWRCLLQEEWDGGSKGKVYTKGKRGKGFV